jgi:hypothetical protein
MKNFLFLLFSFICLVASSQKRTYPTSITINNGNTTYCQNATATQLTISLGTVQCGNGSNANVTHTEKIFVNTINSTVGGTEVSSLSNALFATNATYTPPTTNVGTLYYYAVVEWSVNGCAPSGNITSSVVSVEIFGPNSSVPFSQGFNGAACGWTTQQVSGTAGSITNISSATYETTSPFEGAGFIQFNSFSCAAGNSTRLISPIFTVNSNEVVEIKFNWRNSTTATYSDRIDRVVVQWFDGTTWTDIQTFNRPDSTLNGWQEKICQFNTGNQTNIRIGFRFISAYGYNCALDNVRLQYINPIPLAATLTSFTTECEEGFPVISWTTSSEQNSDYFQIERSRTGIDWLPVSKVHSIGNSTTKQYYQFYDITAGSNFTGYYRINQVDVDGTGVFSDISYLNCISDNKKLDVSGYPNPSTGEFFIRIINDFDCNCIITLTDLSGRISDNFSIENLINGYNLINYNISDIPAGLYTCIIQLCDKKHIINIIKL